MNLLLTVIFGNRNWLQVKLSSNQTVYELYTALNNTLCKGKSNILYLVSCGTILTDMSKTLAATGFFTTGTGVINVIFKLNDIQYDRHDLIAYNNYLDNNHNVQINDLLVSGISLQSIINSQLTTVPVVLTEREYSTLVNTVTVNNIQETICGSCHADLQTDQILSQLPCEHVFHQDCIKTWLTTQSTRCPLCSRDVREP